MGLQTVKNKIAVFSGKGGVGKSTVAVNLAAGIADKGYKVGLLDIDLHGPSVPRLLKLTDERTLMKGDKILPIEYNKNLKVISVGFMLAHQDDPLIWRGALKIKILNQFINDVEWGELDYLIIDSPPGTGDEPLTILQTLGQDTQALIVTTPQTVAVDDVKRSINFCKKMGNPIMGLVENMGSFVCPDTNKEYNLFGKGGGELLSKEYNVPLLASLPIDPQVVEAGDAGNIFTLDFKESALAQRFNKIIDLTIKNTKTESKSL